MREVARWHSPRLEREVTVARWGHWGTPVLLFPTAGGDALEIERMSNALIALREELRDAGLVDTHYHVGPELIVRRYHVKTLADKAVPFGATLVLKNHTYPTTPLASLARGHFGANFLGGVVLNNYVGGLNPQAVQGAHSGNRSNVSDPTPDPMRRFIGSDNTSKTRMMMLLPDTATSVA